MFLYRLITCVFLFLIGTPFGCTQTVETIFGPLKLEGDLEKIYVLPHVQRLKGLQYFGTIADRTDKNAKSFSYLEYSVDIVFLLKRFGAPLQEQIAGFTLHLPNPAFGNVSDKLFGKKNYTKSIQEIVLKQSGLEPILSAHDWTVEDILPNPKKFQQLSQEHPNVCAENIALIVHVGALLGIFKKSDIKILLRNLRFNAQKNIWFFTHMNTAKKFAYAALDIYEKVLSSPDYKVLNLITYLTLKKALALKRLTQNDLSFKTDLEIIQLVKECDDPKLQELIAKAKNIKKAYKILEENQKNAADFIAKEPFKGVDPFVHNKFTKSYKKLSELDAQFAKRYARIQRLSKKGKSIQLGFSVR